MKPIIKKSLVLFCVVITAISSVMFVFPVAAKTNSVGNMVSTKLPKHINIVYDDSGSMVNGDCGANENKNDIKSWSQAKYSLEAFIGMLDEEDKLDIYKISSEGKNPIKVLGSQKKKAVEDIHNDFKTGDCSQETPVKSLLTAGDALASLDKSKEEPWLVIITDGNFTDCDAQTTESYLQKYANELSNHVIIISIAYERTKESTPPPAKYSQKGFTQYYVDDENKTDSKNPILSSVQAAIEQIYSSSRNVADAKIEQSEDKYYVSVKTGGLSINQLIVFVQGGEADVTGADDDVNIQNIEVEYTDVDDAVAYSSRGSTFKGTSNVIRTDTSLHGIVSTITPKEEAIITKDKNEGFKVYLGDDKPESISVYYEPCVTINYSLSNDEQVFMDQNSSKRPCVSPGEYVFSADVVDAATNERISDGLKPDMKVQLLGMQYTLSQLREGVKVNLDKDFKEKCDFDASAGMLDGKYVLDTGNMVEMFNNLVVKDTYMIVIDYQMPKSSINSFRLFSKSNFNLHILKSLSTDDEKHCIKGIISVVNPDTGETVDLTPEQWEMIKTAYESNLAGEESENYVFFGTADTDKNTKVSYTKAKFASELENGKGVFYIAPKYYTKEGGKADKKHTTHTNYVHRSEKYLCKIVGEITLPNITEEIAYSTTATPYERHSGIYEISLCAWHTIVSIILFIILLGYIFKGRLPSQLVQRKFSKGCYKHTASKCNYSGKYDDPYEWKSSETDNSYNKKLIKRQFWSIVLPFIPQQGTLSLCGKNNYANGLKLKIRGSSIFANEFVIINSEKSFDSFQRNINTDDRGLIFSVAGKKLCPETFKSNPNKQFKWFAYLRKYPNILIVRVRNASVKFGGYKDPLFNKYEITLGKRVEPRQNIRRNNHRNNKGKNNKRNTRKK